MAKPHRRLILLTRYPVAGKVKTRLIPALGAEGAAALHRRLVLRTLRTAHALSTSNGVELEIRFAAGSDQEMRHWLGNDWLCRPQGEGDLGQRMKLAFEDSFREGSIATVIIGSDCPGLTPGLLAEAFDRLTSNRVIFGPAMDGGYYLVGLNGPFPQLFRKVSWGTDSVLSRTMEIARATNIEPALIQLLDDLDRPEDLVGWRRMIEPEECDLSRVSVIVPTLNEGPSIAATLESVNSDRPHEIIVVDGGSTDDTMDIATALGTSTFLSPPGRARQMNAGAVRATGNTLLFLHADTQLPKDWSQSVATALGQSRVAGGAFHFKIHGNFLGKRLVELTTNWRSRWLQAPYGDQGIFLVRALFEELGGFADMPIMEDFELVRRVRRHGRVVTLQKAASTSGRRWQELGLLRTTLINQVVVTGYYMGVSHDRLTRLYRSPKTAG